jgi:uncharacterized protein YcbK (DUF882 family)
VKLTTNFSLGEFACNDAAKTPVPADMIPNVKRLAVNLQVLRYKLGHSITIISGYRTEAHNKAVGGAPKSLHLKALAADIRVHAINPALVYRAIEDCIAEGTMQDGGLIVYDRWVHYDNRPGKPYRADKRTLKGGVE